MAEDLRVPRYTRADMIQAAWNHGYSPTDRLLTDWQASGLLDRPSKRGLGRGKGIEALWPESQLRLWLLLLQKRSDVTQLAVLCNIPVGLWMYFGDAYATLRQVRKCMHTWAHRYGSSRGHKAAKQSARALLADVPLTGSANAKANLIGAMAKAMLLGIPSNDERRRLREQMLGPIVNSGIELTKATATVEVVLVRLLGARYLLEGNIPDHVLAWARVYQLHGLRNYYAAHEAGSLPSIAGIDFATPDFEKLIQEACLHLLTAVGMALSLDQGEVLPAPLFHPDMWKDGWAKVRVSWQIEPSRIVLPGDRQRGRLKIIVSND